MIGARDISEKGILSQMGGGMGWDGMGIVDVEFGDHKTKGKMSIDWVFFLCVCVCVCVCRMSEWANVVYVYECNCMCDNKNEK